MPIVTFAQNSSCLKSFYEAKSPIFNRASLAVKTTEICYENFSVMYSGVSRTPLWAAEHLSIEYINNAKEIRSKVALHAEELLLPDIRSELLDYKDSGYTYLQLAPEANMSTDRARYDSYSLANIVPRDGKSDKRLWSAIETATQYLAIQRGELFVVTGPLFEGERITRINKHVFVPTHFYKAIYDPIKKEGAAWLIPNGIGEYKVLSLAELEKRAGINFFPNVPDRSKTYAMIFPDPLGVERRILAEEKSRLEQTRKSDSSQIKISSQVNDTRRRLALVIGNAQYKNSPLRNPINDARDMSDALTASGFAVSRYENLTYSKMREVVRDFGEKLKMGDVGLFYFSGHAVQYRGKNYLLPINEDLKHSDEIPSSSLDIDFVLAKMESAKNDLNIVILDACRNNPIGAESRSLERGLTNISAAKGAFIAFATSPGNVALDGDGKNSPYTKNLTQVIRKGGMTIEQVFKEVRRNVISETNSKQVPWENSSILGDFYFN